MTAERVSASEVARITGFSHRKVQRLAEQGKIPSVATDLSWLTRDPSPADLKRVAPRPRREERKVDRYIYFVRHGTSGPIKIGIADRPHARFQTIQSAHFDDLYLLGIVEGTYEAEQLWHRKFEAHRIRGEWYRPVPELVAAIEQALKRSLHDAAVTQTEPPAACGAVSPADPAGMSR